MKTLFIMGSFCFFLSLLPASTTTADGKEVYVSHCSSCHEGGFKGFMAGAPKTGDAQDWAQLFANGIDAAKEAVLNGSEEHKAMGREENLTKQQVNDAVDHILSTTEISKE